MNSSTDASLQTAAPLTGRITPAAAAAWELLRRRRSLESLAEFRNYMEPSGLADFRYPHATHHALMAHHLERLARREIRRLMLLLPPGSAKSTIGNVQFPSWLLARNPTEQVLAVSHSEGLAEAFARRKRLVLQDPLWRALSGTMLAEDQQSLHRFATAAGGLHVAAGVGSAITGLRASAGIIDDPIPGVETAMSATQLQKQIEWHDSDFRSRLLPDAIELIVTTRWARNDLAGVLIDRHERGEEEWTIIRLPMLSDDPADPLGRELGEPLWPEWYTNRMIVEAQRDPLRWSSLYQQQPLDAAGSWVGHEHVFYLEALPSPLHFYAGVDLALSVGRGDFSVIAVCGFNAKRDLIVAEVWRDRVSPDVTAERLLEIVGRYGIREVVIDDDNASKLFRHVLIEKCRTVSKSPPPLRLMPMRGRDKETRAAPLRSLFLSDRVKIIRGAFTPELVAELLRFPADATGHDDQVDALGLVARLHAERAGPAVEVSAGPLLNPETAAIILRDGKYMLNRTLDDLFEDREQGLHWMRSRID